MVIFLFSATHNTYFCGQIFGLKKILFILLMVVTAKIAFTQTDSLLKPKAETTIIKPKVKPVLQVKPKKIDSSVKIKDSAIALLTVDSAKIKDSIAKTIAVRDSLKLDSVKKAQAIKLPKTDTSTYYTLLNVPGLPFHKKPVFMLMQEKPRESKDELFYLIVGVVLYLAIIRLIFPKYFKNIFRLSFQTSFRQKQTRDQLMQDNLASLLMNLLFFITGGIYIGLLAKQEGIIPFSYWWVMVYCAALLTIIYLGKFLFMQFSGWVFNEKEASGTYTFLIFLVNKIVGVALIPFLFLIAFSSKTIADISITVSLILLVIMLLYRFIVGLGTIHRDLKVNPFHFFLYLCAVEILPLLLLYKALFNYIGNYF